MNCAKCGKSIDQSYEQFGPLHEPLCYDCWQDHERDLAIDDEIRKLRNEIYVLEGQMLQREHEIEIVQETIDGVLKVIKAYEERRCKEAPQTISATREQAMMAWANSF